MGMKFKFEVEVEVERIEGKFASRDDIGEQIKEALESADPGDFVGENEGEYQVADWSVNDA